MDELKYKNDVVCDIIDKTMKKNNKILDEISKINPFSFDGEVTIFDELDKKIEKNKKQIRKTAELHAEQRKRKAIEFDHEFDARLDILFKKIRNHLDGKIDGL